MAWTWNTQTLRCKTISSWLAIVRALQILGALLSMIFNGCLLAWLRKNDQRNDEVESSRSTLIALELMSCIALVYSSGVLLVIYTRDRRRHQPMTKTIATAFVLCDAVCVGLMLAIITILAQSGVPKDCKRLKERKNEGDLRRSLKDLEDLCSLEKIFYSLVIALVYSYIITIVLSMLQYLETLYTKNTKIDDVLASADNVHQLQHMRSKITEPQSATDAEAPSMMPSQGMPGQGRGAATGAVVAPPSSSMPPSSLSRTTPGHSPGGGAYSASTAPTTTASFSTLPTIHPPREPGPRPTFAVSPITPPTQSPIDAIQPAGVGMSAYPPEDPAEAAMVTDGFRRQPSMMTSTTSYPGSLPPYSPGPSRRFMAGHGDESNEMRLSEYTKGQTRAQHMKDSGGGF